MSVEDQKQLITETLKQSTVWIADATVERTGDGWAARLLLNPDVAGGRAEQQGMRDKSLRSAIKEPRVIRLLDSYITDVNKVLPSSCQILSREFDVSLEPETSTRANGQAPARYNAEVSDSGRLPASVDRRRFGPVCVSGLR